MRFKYQKSPLIEVTCAFSLKTSGWGDSSPGELRQQLKDEYPHETKHPSASIELILGKQEVRGKFETRTHFSSDDRKNIIQADQNELRVHRLSPYPSWGEYRGRIQRATKCYNDVVGQLEIRDAILTYINRISVPLGKRGSVALSDYFKLGPWMTDDFNNGINSFSVGVGKVFDEKNNVLKISLKNGGPRKDKLVDFHLNIEYRVGASKKMAFDEIGEWLEKAHTRCVEAFEGAIFDKTKQLLGRVVLDG